MQLLRGRALALGRRHSGGLDDLLEDGEGRGVGRAGGGSALACAQGGPSHGLEAPSPLVGVRLRLDAGASRRPATLPSAPQPIRLPAFPPTQAPPPPCVQSHPRPIRPPPPTWMQGPRTRWREPISWYSCSTAPLSVVSRYSCRRTGGTGGQSGVVGGSGGAGGNTSPARVWQPTRGSSDPQPPERPTGRPAGARLPYGAPCRRCGSPSATGSAPRCRSSSRWWGCAQRSANGWGGRNARRRQA